MNEAAAAYCILSEDPLAEETLVGHQPADCELPRKLDGYFFFWAFSAAFVTLPWVSLKVTLCKLIDFNVKSLPMILLEGITIRDTRDIVLSYRFVSFENISKQR